MSPPAPRLRVLEHVPDSLFHTPARDLERVLGGPTLLRIAGEQALSPLFVSTLLHGNETSGWTALCRLLGRGALPRRPLLVFLGNVAAAAAGVRHLPGEPDFNRIWKNADPPYAAFAASVLNHVVSEPLAAAIDLHNNTGRNPHYSVLTDLSDANRSLAYLFSDKAVYVEEPDSVLTRATQQHCPSIAVELGPINDPHSDDLAEDLLRRVTAAPSLTPSHDGLTLYTSLARVHINPDVAFSFAGTGPPAPLVLTGGMEAVNFHAVPRHTEFAYTQRPFQETIQVLDPGHRNVTDQFFYQEGPHVRFARDVVPAMYTTDPDVVRQDCLCYLMAPLSPRKATPTSHPPPVQ
ncbi:MAG: succinylglutamate desuccinylase/aspartoacylase family protein [Pseudomonadales bacterium]